MTSRIGQQLGNHHLIRLLGQGGFAEVYLGEHIYLKTQAAVKLPAGPMTPKSVQDFLKEARIVARLSHQNIVHVFDFGVDQSNTVPFLVMDYVPKGALRQLYSDGTSLDPVDIVRYSKQVAEALRYAHEQKVIHRDVKPENMLVGSNGAVVLSDFGIAVAIHSTLSRSSQEAAGTISYMAPEQINGKPCPASDQYSLGVVIYEWLCGARPFTGTTYIEIAMQHLHDSPPLLRKKNPSISPAVEQVVLKALAKNPQQRFPQVQDFTNALEKALQPLLSSSHMLPTRVLSLQRRIPRRIVLGGIIAVSVVSSIIGIGAAIISSMTSTVTSSSAMFGFNLQRTNFNSNENTLTTGNVSQLVSYWTTTTGGAILSSPAIANGTVYVGSNDRKLYALDASTGKVLWTVTTGDAIYTSPAVDNGTVYVGSNDGNIYACNLSKGASLWKTSNNQFNTSSLAITNGVIYVGGSTVTSNVLPDALPRLNALNSSTGKSFWSPQIGETNSGCSFYSNCTYPESSLSSPTVANGVIYVASTNGNLYAIDASTQALFFWAPPTGQILTKIEIGPNIEADNTSQFFLVSSPLVADGGVYVGSSDGSLHAFHMLGTTPS